MPIRAALFDFDGTLADSFAAITASTNHVRSTFGLPALPETTVREHVGFGLPQLMVELVPDHDPQEAVDRYREHHASIMFAGTKLMPGVEATLRELDRRGLKLAVCSNKQVSFTMQLVESFGLSPIVRTVLGPDDVQGRAKPDPAMVIEGLRLLGVSREESVYVGDMSIDVHTARAAGMLVWLVPGGAAGKESAEATGPDRVLKDFAELLDLLPGVG